MGRKQDDFIRGMEAGAKPFEEKFEKLSEETHQMGKKIDGKLDSLGEVIDILADDLSDMQKKELYNLNTPYDLKDDLDDDEKEIVVSLLLYLSKSAENNEYQKKFLRSVINYTGEKAAQGEFDVACIENIENIKVQKIILQTIMEYFYLETEDFSFLEQMEDIFGYFSVNKKGIQEIKTNIETIYRATGKEGLAEKYGFVPAEETTEAESPGKSYEFSCYDGGDISEACADEININRHYVVLKDFLVFCDKWKIYRVHKQTGEKTVIEVEKEYKYKEEITAFNLCGYDKYIYLIFKDELYRADLSIDVSMKKIAEIEGGKYSDLFSDNRGVFPQCNDKYLVYRTSMWDSDSLYCIDLETMNEKEIYVGGNFKLIDDVVYLCCGAFWKYDLKEGTLKDITYESIDEEELEKINSEFRTSDLFRDEIDDPKTSQYGKFVISWLDNGVYASFDLEKERCKCCKLDVVPSDTMDYRVFIAYNYIYYVSTDASVKRYDIFTNEVEKIIEAKNVIGYCKSGGIFSRKTIPVMHLTAVKFQVVGKWLYYLDKLGTIHKVNIAEKRDEVLN